MAMTRHVIGAKPDVPRQMVAQISGMVAVPAWKQAAPQAHDPRARRKNGIEFQATPRRVKRTLCHGVHFQKRDMSPDMHPCNAAHKDNCLTVCVRKSHINPMPRNLPPLNALRAFEAAGRHQSFSRAAEELGVSHSAISRHVRGLELRLKARLFRDLPRGLELTRDGAVYLAHLSPAFDAIAEATDALTERPAGMITVNCEPMFATKWLIPNLGSFANRHPEIEIRLEASDALADVSRYATDVAIRYVHSGVPNQPATLLSNAALYPYASADLIAQPVTTPADLLAYPLLKDRHSDTWGHWFDLAGGVDPAAVPKPAWRMRAHLSLEMAIAGQGVILCSAEVVAGDVAAGRLIRVSSLGFQEGGYYLILAEGAPRRKAIRVFRDWIVTHSQSMRQDAPGI